jgi:hypothetical protein
VRTDGQVAPDASCTGTRPDASESGSDYSGCSYAWHAGQWSAPSTSCGLATQTRDVGCQRSDGASAPDAACSVAGSGARPESTQQVQVVASCSYDWSIGPWGAAAPACGASAQTRTVSCQRADGSAVADSFCSSDRPSTTQVASDYSACADGRSNAQPYNWTVGDWSAPSSTCGPATETRSASCLDGSGKAVAETMCVGDRPVTGKTSQETSGCSYSWDAGAFGAPQPACGATARTRNVSCRRSDGTTADPAMCGGQAPESSQPTTDYSACSYAWSTTGWSDWSSACGDATRTRTATCQRADGATVDDALCTGARPDLTQSSHQTVGCGYSWRQGGFGATTPACGPSTQSQTVTCLRGDGQTVEDAQCVASVGPAPATTRSGSDYSTCTYAWQQGSYSAPSTSCGLATQTRSVTCQRSDGTTVADAQCPGTKPDTSTSSQQISGCSYSWSQGGFGSSAPACGASSQSQTVTCMRSDGAVASDPALCTAPMPATSRATTDYSTCTYAWSYGQWQGTAGCGNTVTQTRSASCDRSDGTVGVDGRFCGSSAQTTQPITDYSQCSYSWVSTPGAWSSTCSTSATRPETVVCRRQDGTTVADAFCSASSKPATQDVGNLSGCTYTPSYTLGSCTPVNNGGLAGTQPVTITKCMRSDGTTVGNEQCSVATPSCTLTYTPTYGAYGSCAPGSVGSSTGTQTASVSSCAMRGSDGSGPTSVSTNYCQPQQQQQSCSGVTWTYSGTYANYSSCTSSQQTGSLSSGTCQATATWNGVAQSPVAVADSKCAATKVVSCNSTIATDGYEGGSTSGGLSGSRSDGTATTAFVSNPVHGGSGALRLGYANSSSTTYPYPFVSHGFAVKAGVTYSGYMWVYYAGSGSNGPISYLFQPSANDGTTRSTSTISQVTTQGVWTKVSWGFTAQFNGTASVSTVSGDPVAYTYTDDFLATQ